ncbi:oligosaccharide flippase family protein [Candidatus Falkowbacteria bacterium]|nr:oligosaccharide flippase family protein [Candidatus Falkowbacteria bacterium]
MGVDNLKSKLFLGSAYQYSAIIVGAFFGFLTIALLVRKLSLEDFGFYNFVGSFILFVDIATSFGLVSVVQRYLPEYRAKKDAGFQKKIITSALASRLVAIIVFGAAFFFLRDYVIDFFKLPEYFNGLLPLILLLILFKLQSQIVGDAALVSIFENKFFGLVKNFYNVFKFALFYLSLRSGYGITGVLYVWCFMELAALLLYSYKIRTSVYSLPENGSTEALPYRRFFNFGVQLWIHNILYLFRDRVADVFIISYFWGQAEVGLYSLAFGIPLTVFAFSPGNVLRSISISFLTHKYSLDHDKSTVNHFFQIINKVTFFTIWPVLVIFAVLAEEIMTIVFRSGHPGIVGWFAVSAGFAFIAQFLSAFSVVLYTIEESKIALRASTFYLYNLLMDLLLVPRFGYGGAILATGTTSILLIPYYLLTFKRFGLELRYPWKAFLVMVLNSVPMILVLYLASSHVKSIAQLGLISLVSFSVYLFASYCNKAFDESDRNFINEAMGRKVWNF